MKYFYMVVNKEKDPEYRIARKIQEYLKQKGASCSFQENTGSGGEFYYSDASLVPEKTQCVLVLGGDGTIIQAARDLACKSLPLLGVNLGTLGYLTRVDTDLIFPALDRLLKDDYQVENRMMLEGVTRGPEGEKKDLALNDIVIGRYGSLKPVHYELSVNGEVLNRYTADGIIISTPTGSTAYNLSAGGPIVEPTASMILITPIAPHTLNNRSIILAAENTVRIRILGGSGKEQASVAFDGNESAVLFPGDVVTARRSGKVARLIKFGNASFLETLRVKMSD